MSKFRGEICKRGPIRFPTSNLGGLIEDVRRNKFLVSVTMPMQWNNQENVNTWVNHHVKIQGGNMQENGVFPGTVHNSTSLEPYLTQARKGMQNLQGKGRQAQNS